MRNDTLTQLRVIGFPYFLKIMTELPLPRNPRLGRISMLPQILGNLAEYKNFAFSFMSQDP